MSSAREIALAYFSAWTGKDMDQAMTYVAEDIICDAPAGRIVGKEEYRAFLGPFAQMLISSSLLAAYGDDEQAILMYDTKTPPVPSAPGAEYLTIVDGKITASRFLFDRLPFEQARAAQ